jgi:hypothetical protein
MLLLSSEMSFSIQSPVMGVPGSPSYVKSISDTLEDRLAKWKKSSRSTDPRNLHVCMKPDSVDRPGVHTKL